MKELSFSMDIRFQIPDESMKLSELFVGISNNLPETEKALFMTPIKGLESKAIQRYLKRASGRYVRNRHKSQRRNFRTFWEIGLPQCPTS